MITADTYVQKEKNSFTGFTFTVIPEILGIKLCIWMEGKIFPMPN
jgi:hypothetical protein